MKQGKSLGYQCRRDVGILDLYSKPAKRFGNGPSHSSVTGRRAARGPPRGHPTWLSQRRICSLQMPIILIVLVYLVIFIFHETDGSVRDMFGERPNWPSSAHGESRMD